MNRDEYIAKWNAFSWEMSEAVSAYYALLGAVEWQDVFMGSLKSGLAVRPPMHIEAVTIFSKAVLTHFFVTACRIRETTNTQFSLPILVEDVASAVSPDAAGMASMQALIDKTKPSFDKIKKVRGMSIAHLHGGESPFEVIKREQVTRNMVRSYLEDCLALYALLGQSIGSDFSADITRYQACQVAVSTALHQLSPVEQK